MSKGRKVHTLGLFLTWKMSLGNENGNTDILTSTRQSVGIQDNMNNLPEWLGRRNKCLHLQKTTLTKIQLSSCFWQNSLHSTEGPAQPCFPLAAASRDSDHPLPHPHRREHKPQPKDKGFQTLILHYLELGSSAKTQTLKLFHWTIQCQREANPRSSLPWTRDSHQG